jgi:hypothetical protein
MTNIKKRGRPAGTKNTGNKINWEVLAKQLQQALAKEIKENDELREHNTQLITQGIKLLGAIEYLENKRGHNPV